MKIFTLKHLFSYQILVYSHQIVGTRMTNMVSVFQAMKMVEEFSPRLDVVELELTNALNQVLATDVHSPINMPPFNQSAMDGYAVCMHDSNTYSLIGEVKAGDDSKYNLTAGEAIRIFTGAMVPNGADAVIKQEDVDRPSDHILITAETKAGMNVRPCGEQIKLNTLAIPAGSILNPGSIGFLSTLGITHVNVYRKPKIVVLATGSELVKPGNNLSGGEIFESNTFMLQAALNKSGFSAEISSVKDDYELTKKAISEAISNCDMVLITGGISVGDYDFVGKALHELNVTTQFYKVKQKPGKPLLFGTKDSKVIFALPGNPAAVLSCYYAYVEPSLRKQIGVSPVFPRKKFTLASHYKKTAKMTHFLKARLENETIEILSAQSSAMLSSFVEANCIIVLEQDRENWEVGDQVEVILL